MYFWIKVFISAVLIAVISELAKRSTFFGALIASLPVISILALSWLYYDTHDTPKIITMSYGIFWLVIPSLAFFLSLPLLLKSGMRFSLAMVVAAVVTILAYSGFTYFLRRFGFH